jgi:hypothetical protein
MSIALLSPTAVLRDGVPIGDITAAVQAYPAEVVAIAQALVAYERAELLQTHNTQVTAALAARAQALEGAELAAAATTAALEAKASAEAERDTALAQVTTLTAQVAQLQADLAAAQEP